MGDQCPHCGDDLINWGTYEETDDAGRVVAYDLWACDNHETCSYAERRNVHFADPVTVWGARMDGIAPQVGEPRRPGDGQ